MDTPPEHPLSAAIREHPYVLDLYRRSGRVYLQGDRRFQHEIYLNVDGDMDFAIIETITGIFEHWISERGKRWLDYRTNSFDAIITELIRSSRAAFLFDLAPGCPYHRAPDSVAFETIGASGASAAWGSGDDEEWIEFHGDGRLHTALGFAHLLVAPRRSVMLRAQITASQPGGRTVQSYCGPRPGWNLTVAQWREWLAGDPPCTWIGPKPVP